MRVGFLVEQLLAPVPGGTGRYSAELATALARRAAAGDGVVGWCAGGAGGARADGAAGGWGGQPASGGELAAGDGWERS
ncbi:hypothetical protein ND748_20115, partial [Frankia sp. AiPs1]|nr:hypothetical protein [Frankia sp. AiPs1]